MGEKVGGLGWTGLGLDLDLDWTGLTKGWTGIDSEVLEVFEMGKSKKKKKKKKKTWKLKSKPKLN